MRTSGTPSHTTRAALPYTDLVTDLEACLQRMNACCEAELFVLSARFDTPLILAGEVARIMVEADELVARLQRAVNHFYALNEELTSVQGQAVEETGLGLAHLTPDIFPPPLAARFTELLEDKRHTRESITAIEQAFEHVFASMQALVPRGHLLTHSTDSGEFPHDVVAQCRGVAVEYTTHLEALRGPATISGCDRQLLELTAGLDNIDTKVRDYELALDELRDARRNPNSYKEDFLLVHEAVQEDLGRDIHTAVWEFLARYAVDEQSVAARLIEDELEV